MRLAIEVPKMWRAWMGKVIADVDKSGFRIRCDRETIEKRNKINELVVTVAELVASQILNKYNETKMIREKDSILIVSENIAKKENIAKTGEHEIASFLIKSKKKPVEGIVYLKSLDDASKRWNPFNAEFWESTYEIFCDKRLTRYYKDITNTVLKTAQAVILEIRKTFKKPLSYWKEGHGLVFVVEHEIDEIEGVK